MADDVQTPRSRGSLCGLALILLGAWAGLAPFAGPSLRFGFTPDRAWAYTSGRLYLSALPGVIVLLAGLIVAMTRSRSFGGFCAFVAALGGVWLIAGAALVKLLPASQAASITVGTPIRASASAQVLTGLAFFTGVGALIVFFAAVALGRFSITALKDYVGPAAEMGDGTGIVGAGAYQADQDPQTTQQFGQPQYTSQYPSGRDPFPPSQYPATEQYPAAGQYPATEQYPAAGQYPATEQYPQRDPFGLTRDTTVPGQYPQSPIPFPPAQYQGYRDQTLPESTTAIERPSGQDPAAPPA
jgi:hypothetical protein